MERRVEQIIMALEEEYRGAKTALEYNNPFQLLIATILSAQSTDNQVNKITRKLFSKYPSPEKLAKLSEAELANEIKGCGLYRMKAKNILATTRIIMDEYEGKVPPERETLMRLPGVGRKTANVVLANAFKVPALAVDTHVLRVANRLGLANSKNPLEVEKTLMEKVPQEKWSDLHHWLIWHGRKICKARKPLCVGCPVLVHCPSSKEGENK